MFTQPIHPPWEFFFGMLFLPWHHFHLFFWVWRFLTYFISVHVHPHVHTNFFHRKFMSMKPLRLQPQPLVLFWSYVPLPLRPSPGYGSLLLSGNASKVAPLFVCGEPVYARAPINMCSLLPSFDTLRPSFSKREGFRLCTLFQCGQIHFRRTSKESIRPKVDRVSPLCR